jgi:hypothetical protein
LTKEDKKRNKEISSSRVINEHTIGFIKRFKIVSERYRNRRKRFGLRFNLVAGICNSELSFDLARGLLPYYLCIAVEH